MIFIFDFDSTLFPYESLEDLIVSTIKDSDKKKQVLTQMSEISDRAMNGDLDFKSSLKQRIELITIQSKDINNYFELRKNDFDSKIIQLIDELKLKHHIYIVSGGFKDYLSSFAQHSFGLNTPQLFANQFIFDDKQKTTNFDENNILVKSDGKVEIAQKIKQSHKDQKLIMVGDGFTDWLVYERKVADFFIGAGFYKTREKVKQKTIEHKQNFAQTIDDLILAIHQIIKLNQAN